MTRDPARLSGLVRDELARMTAATAADLVPGAPRRALGVGAASPLPYSNGRTLIVPVVLAPVHLRVATELGLRFTVRFADDGTAVILEHPDRADLATATAMVLDGERRALDVAIAALARTATSPAGHSWADALRVMRLDPRLPADKLAGSPSWTLIFDPWSDATGYPSVLIELPGFGVSLVNGKKPP